MLRLVSVSIVAGALLAVTAARAQEATPPTGPGSMSQAPMSQAPAPQAPAAQGAPHAQQPGNQFCSSDIQPMLVKREELGKALQSINKRPKPKTFAVAKKNFNDFCGTMGSFIATNTKLLDYMRKNKDFCVIADKDISDTSTMIATLTKTRTKICAHPPREQTAPPPQTGGAPALPKPPVNLRLQ